MRIFVVKLLLGLLFVPHRKHNQLNLLFIFVLVVCFIAILLFRFSSDLFLLLFVGFDRLLVLIFELFLLNCQIILSLDSTIFMLFDFIFAVLSCQSCKGFSSCDIEFTSFDSFSKPLVQLAQTDVVRINVLLSDSINDFLAVIDCVVASELT